MNWSTLYPGYVVEEDDGALLDDTRRKKLLKDVDVVDIGCGFGGLLVALAPLLPDNLLLGE